MPNDNPRDDLLRNFDATISGMGLDDLRGISDRLAPTSDGFTRQPGRPELRRPARRRRVVYRVRVSLDGSDGRIWRRLDLRSDLTLDTVHQVLQAAFGWADAHLYRFAIGGHPFDWTSQVFLCPFDAAERASGDADSPVAADVRLDQTVRDAGDELRYLYDYGDGWDVTLRLEDVLPAPTNARFPLAAVVNGELAAPPENSGGDWAIENMADLVPDPARFDIDGVREALRAPHLTLRELGVNPVLVDLIGRLYHEPVGQDLMDRLLQLLEEPRTLDGAYLASGFAAHRWFLDRAAGGGIRLTDAGYLTPEDVESACRVVPTVRDWFGKGNREYHTRPLLEFRESLQSLGLLRKYKGALLLTRAGAAAQRDPGVLWAHLAERLARPDRLEVVTEAKLLLLVYASTSAGEELPVDAISEALAALGWVSADGRTSIGPLVYDLPAYDTLVNLEERPSGLRTYSWISPSAAALARAALLAPS